MSINSWCLSNYIPVFGFLRLNHLHLGLGLNLSAILWRCFTKLIVFEAVMFYTSFFCQRYRNMHLHSSVYHCCYFALRSLVARYALVIETQRFCTKNKLNKNVFLQTSQVTNVLKKVRGTKYFGIYVFEKKPDIRFHDLDVKTCIASYKDT